MIARDVIAFGRRVEDFLADPQVTAFFQGLALEAFSRFKEATNDEERVKAQAFALALEELKAALEGAAQNGHLAERESREQD